jgi:hypothetical protein
MPASTHEGQVGGGPFTGLCCAKAGSPGWPRRDRTQERKTRDRHNWTAHNAALKARVVDDLNKDMPWYAPASGQRSSGGLLRCRHHSEHQVPAQSGPCVKAWAWLKPVAPGGPGSARARLQHRVLAVNAAGTSAALPRQHHRAGSAGRPAQDQALPGRRQVDAQAARTGTAAGEPLGMDATRWRFRPSRCNSVEGQRRWCAMLLSCWRRYRR